MLKSARVRNFQLVRDLKIDFGDVTALVGESERGKSSLFRGIESAIINARGSKFIRTGQSACNVILESENGTVEWKKKREGSATYIVTTADGKQEIFEKVEECPELARKVLGLFPVQFGEDVFLTVNLAGQFEPPFLIFDTGTVVAKVLGKFTRLDEVYGAVRLANKDLQNLRHDEQAGRRGLETAKTRLDEHEGVGKLEPLLGSLEKLTKRFQAAESSLEKFEDGLREAKSLRSKISAFRVDEKLAASLGGWSETGLRDKVQLLQGMSKDYHALKRLLSQVAEAALSVKACAAKAKSAGNELAKFKASNTLCPACAKPWTI